MSSGPRALSLLLAQELDQVVFQVREAILHDGQAAVGDALEGLAAIQDNLVEFLCSIRVKEANARKAAAHLAEICIATLKGVEHEGSSPAGIDMRVLG